MKKLVFTVVALLACVLGASADQMHFKVDDLWFSTLSEEQLAEYNLPENSVAVIRPPMLPQYTQEEITVPATVEYDGTEYVVGAFQMWVFGECENLRKLNFETRSVSLRMSVANCPQLEEVALPSGLKVVGGFHNCPSLREIELPQGLEKICDNSFSEMGLRHVVIPASVEEIGSYCFTDIPLDVLEFEGGKYIFDYSFSNLGGALSVVRFPTVLRTICFGAFRDNDFEEVWFSDNADGEPLKIDYAAFNDTGVKRIYCNCRTVPEMFGPEIHNYVGENHPYDPSSGEPPAVFPFKNEAKGISTVGDLKNITLYVPYGCREMYAAHHFWTNFNIEESDFKAGVSLKEAGSNGVTVRCGDGNITVYGLSAGNRVNVYTPAGTMAAIISADSDGVAEIRLTPGIYVVKTGDYAAKVVVNQ